MFLGIGRGDNYTKYHLLHYFHVVSDDRKDIYQPTYTGEIWISERPLLTSQHTIAKRNGAVRKRKRKRKLIFAPVDLSIFPNDFT